MLHGATEKLGNTRFNVQVLRTKDIIQGFDNIIKVEETDPSVMIYNFEPSNGGEWTSIVKEGAVRLMKELRLQFKAQTKTCYPRNCRSFTRCGKVFRTLVISDGELSCDGGLGMDPTGSMFNFSVEGRTLCFNNESNRDKFMNFLLNGKSTPFEYNEVCFIFNQFAQCFVDFCYCYHRPPSIRTPISFVHHLRKAVGRGMEMWVGILCLYRKIISMRCSRQTQTTKLNF